MEGVNFISSQCWIQPPLPLTLVPNLATQLSATLVLGEERKFILIQTILFWKKLYNNTVKKIISFLKNIHEINPVTCFVQKSKDKKCIFF